MPKHLQIGPCCFLKILKTDECTSSTGFIRQSYRPQVTSSESIFAVSVDVPASLLLAFQVSISLISNSNQYPAFKKVWNSIILAYQIRKS